MSRATRLAGYTVLRCWVPHNPDQQSTSLSFLLSISSLTIYRRRRQARAQRKKEGERAAKQEAQRCERERRKHGKSELAIELELLRLTPVERERR